MVVVVVVVVAVAVNREESHSERGMSEQSMLLGYTF